jgi:hypothetical protein
MPPAWINQDDQQVKQRGTEWTSWDVGWLDPDPRRRNRVPLPSSDGLSVALGRSPMATGLRIILCCVFWAGRRLSASHVLLPSRCDPLWT